LLILFYFTLNFIIILWLR